MKLTDKEIGCIQDSRLASEQQLALTDAQLELLQSKGLFNIWVPRDYGGLELDFKEGLELLLEFAYWDGGLGWTLTLCSGANMFAGFLNPSLAKKIFTQMEVCWGGSGQATGKAVAEDGGYRISGKWSYATGAPHLSHFTLNAPIYNAYGPVLNDDGEPKVLSFFIEKEQVLIHYDWEAFGLRATASHSFSVDGVFVGHEHSFELLPGKAFSSYPLYKIPFLPFAHATLLVNYLGMFKRYLYLAEKHFLVALKNTQSEEVKGHLKRNVQSIDAEHREVERFEAEFWDIINAIQEAVATEDPLSAELLSSLEAISKDFVKKSRATVSSMFHLLGMDAARSTSEINSVFRNLYTASQHSLLNL